MPNFIEKVRNTYLMLTNKSVPSPPREHTLSAMSPMATQRHWYDTNAAVLAPIQVRIAIDVASVQLRHVRLDKFGDYLEDIPGELNDRLNGSANIDQYAFAFIQELVMNLLEYGTAIAVPTEVTTDPTFATAYDILSLRTGIPEEWFNKSVRINVYNEDTGDRTSLTLPKNFVAIVYNPLYSIMNQHNSTLKRLIDKRAILDLLDNKLGSPALDLILQLPYVVRDDQKKTLAEARLRDIEEQLERSRYGIAYIGGAEKITQLNRAVDNNLPEQIAYLTTSLYEQLGLTDKMMSGTSTEEETLSYFNRTVSPISKSIAAAYTMTFLSKTARRQGQAIIGVPDLFKMAPISTLAEVADKFTRNEIMTSNEVRARLGLAQVKNNPDADALRNKNINKNSTDANQVDVPGEQMPGGTNDREKQTE